MPLSEIRRQLFSGEIKPRDLEKYIHKEHFNSKPEHWGEACTHAKRLRAEWLEHQTGVQIPTIKASGIATHTEPSEPQPSSTMATIAGELSAKPEISKRAKEGTTGIENAIGGFVVPGGFAGPLKIHGEHANGEFHVPLATNESALIAAIQRGMQILNRSGGVKTTILHDGMTRAPLLEFDSAREAHEFAKEVEGGGELYQVMRHAAQRRSTVTRLQDIHPYVTGRNVFLRFKYHTGDAMGMNSATVYSQQAIEAVQEHLEQQRRPVPRLIALSGNVCADKKSTALNVSEGRGKTVIAEAVIPKEVLQTAFGRNAPVTAQDIERLNWKKNYLGSAVAGTLGGFNANAANPVSAVFLATGQDAAQLVESASAFTLAEADLHGNLHVSVTLPALEVGTMGGGTVFGTAHEALKLLGCAGAGPVPGHHARKLAEIVAATTLAGEVNLLGSLATHQLASGHDKLARGAHQK